MNKLNTIIKKAFVDIPTGISRRLKRKTLLSQIKSTGSNFIFDPDSIIITPHLLVVGNNVYIGEQAHISAELTIGNNVMFGPRLLVSGGNHFFAVKGWSTRSLRPKDRENSKPILIEDEVWCGASVTILSGATIGMGSVVGAGSVITKSIPPYVVATGNYCRPIKRIFDDKTLYEHLILLGKSPEFANSLIERREAELRNFGLEGIPAIDRSHTYWEYATS